MVSKTLQEEFMYLNNLSNLQLAKFLGIALQPFILLESEIITKIQLGSFGILTGKATWLKPLEQAFAIMSMDGFSLEILKITLREIRPELGNLEDPKEEFQRWLDENNQNLGELLNEELCSDLINRSIDKRYLLQQRWRTQTQSLLPILESLASNYKPNMPGSNNTLWQCVDNKILFGLLKDILDFYFDSPVFSKVSVFMSLEFFQEIRSAMLKRSIQEFCGTHSLEETYLYLGKDMYKEIRNYYLKKQDNNFPENTDQWPDPLRNFFAKYETEAGLIEFGKLAYTRILIELKQEDPLFQLTEEGLNEELVQLSLRERWKEFFYARIAGILKDIYEPHSN